MNLTAAALRRAAVLVQAAGACVVAACLSSLAGWPWPLALGAGIVVVLLIFGASVALAFAATLGGVGIPAAQRPAADMRADGPARLQPHMPGDIPRRSSLDLRSALACFFAEYRAVFRMFNWLQPFHSRLSFAPPAHPLPDAPPVLLVHGYGCNHAIWLDMAPALAEAGYCCEGIDLTPVLGDIDQYAVQLLQRMRAIKARSGRAPLLVCHSMGGLAARAAQVLAARSGDPDACAGIVTLGSPHRGCALARFGSGHNARQMRWQSPWLIALAAAETPAMRVRMVSVFSWHDSIAGPPGTSWLDGAHHLALDGIGHVSLLRHRRAIDATLTALSILRREAAARAALAAP